jgi:molybdate transport system substrate-binding protein
MNRRSLLALASVIDLALAHSVPVRAQTESLTVFAAASMKNALDEVNAAYTKTTGVKVTTSYAASSALMKQIENGAPADIFASADLEWMDYGSQKKLITDSSRVNLLGNRLVLIAPKDAATKEVRLAPGVVLLALAGDGRIATGDVKAVPVGRYARAALEKLGVWSAIEPRMAMTENVRAALTLVARAEAPLGIVYSTDAKVEPAVKVIGTFPEDSHPPIVYPVAATVTAKSGAARYLSFLRSQTAKEIFERYGFAFLVQPTS